MGRRLGLHVAFLTVVLLALVATVGTDSVVSADEGAMLAELDLLDRTGEWTLPNPEPEVDPDMRWLPLELSERSTEGRWAPFAKHPAHIAVLRPLWAAGGLGGALVLSVAGVVGASLAAATLANRLRPGMGVAALWMAGVGSPLLFDGFQVVGHAIGVATFGLAAVAALRATDAGRTGARAAWVVLTAAMVAATALVRAEGVLAGVALGLVLCAVAWRDRSRRPGAVAAGVASLVAAGATRLGEPMLIDAVLGAPAAGTYAPPAASGGFLSDRWSGFRVTVLDAGYGVEASEPLLFLSVVLAVGAALVWRLRRDAALFRVLAIAASAAAVARMLTASFLVPGLLVALPVVPVALALLRADRLARWPRPLLWGTAALTVGAVVATQYSTGGTGEWGGRYFAVCLSVLVAVAVVTAWEGTDDQDGRTRRFGAVCLCVIAASLGVGAVRAMDRARQASDRVATSVIAEVDRLAVDATVATQGAVSRFAWEDVLDGRRWFTAPADDLESLLDGLAGTDVDRLALVTADVRRDVHGVAEPAGWEATDEARVRPGLRVVLLER